VSARLALLGAASLSFVAIVHGQRGGGAGPAASETVAFEDVTQAAGLRFQHTNGATPEKHMVETMGSGGLFFDYDNDGWIDIFLVDGGSVADRQVTRQARHRLYHNRGLGAFDDVTASSGITHADNGIGACAADYDNDGLKDLYVTNDGPNSLFRNTGNGVFADVTRAAGVGSPLLSTSCAFLDVDRDGDVDLFVANYVDLRAERQCGDSRVRAYCRPELYDGLPNILYRNNGNGTFSDVSREAGMLGVTGKGLGVAVGDYDNDGWPDVFVANDLTPDFLYHNTGGGEFEEVGLLAGVAVASDGRARAGMGTDFGDYDGDGLLDLVVTNFMGESHNIFGNLGDGLFMDATLASGIGQPTLPFVGFGALFVDYDQDADLDLIIANGHVLDNADHFTPKATYAQQNLLLRNQGGRFTDVAAMAGPGFALVKVSRGLFAGDIDNDGDLDLLVTNNGQTADLLRNDQGHPGNALLVRVVGTTSNRDGLGARLRLAAGGKTQLREVKSGSSYLGQSDARVHFGVGRTAALDRLEVVWPSGETDVVDGPPLNHIITIVEGQGLTEQSPFASQ